MDLYIYIYMTYTHMYVCMYVHKHTRLSSRVPPSLGLVFLGLAVFRWALWGRVVGLRVSGFWVSLRTRLCNGCACCKGPGFAQEQRGWWTALHQPAKQEPRCHRLCRPGFLAFRYLLAADMGLQVS